MLPDQETNQLTVPADRLRQVCDPAVFPAETTAGIAPLEEVIGQERALRAITFGLDISSSGFNLFLAGPPGTGKTIILKRILEEAARDRAVPGDVCCVHNFEEPDTPRVLTLPPGKGSQLQRDLQELVRDLQVQVPRTFEGKEYQEQERRFTEAVGERKQALFDRLKDQALQAGFQVQATPTGIQSSPLWRGKPLTREGFERLEAHERERIEAEMEVIQGRIRDFVSQVKELDQGLKQQVREFNRHVAMNILDALMQDLRRRYEECPGVLAYLEQVRRDVVENIEQFKPQEEGQGPVPGLGLGALEPDLTRYRVNLLVDNSQLRGAPVVVETHPTYANLFGRIDRRAQFGALITDFTMIRAGSLVRARGGYLVLNVEDLLRHPFVYDALKRAIQDGQVRIEEPAERFGLVASQTLRPQPIPLEVKVCLIGAPLHYHLLYAMDEEFRESFKVKADFDYQADRTDDTARKLAAFVARVAAEERLPAFDRTALAAIVDESSRWVEDQQKVSLQFKQVSDLVREAAYWARKDGVSTVTGAHVERAVEEIEYRSSLVKERVQELIQRDVLTVETCGERVGQVNGLAVHMLGDYIFGRPSRITARVHLGAEGVINIERRVLLSHSTHDKGVLILAGFLGERFAQERPLSLTASLTFEQSYSEVAGDSASSAELYALLSALAGVPLRQGIAVTGSVDQGGRVQAVGGVNHKIEGFFEVCQVRGLTGAEGVIIPRANVQHLMLRRPVVAAVRDGLFRIWAVEHVDQGIEILTGLPAGTGQAGGGWSAGSINDGVDRRLRELGERLRSWGRERAPEVLAPSGEPSPEPPPPRPPERPRS